MKYTLTEVIDTVAWSDGVNHAPAEMVKLAKEMAEKGEPGIFGKAPHPTNSGSYCWVLLSINPEGKLYVAQRSMALVEITSAS